MLEIEGGADTNTSRVAFVQASVHVNIGTVEGGSGEARGRRSGAAEEKGEKCKKEHCAGWSDLETVQISSGLVLVGLPKLRCSSPLYIAVSWPAKAKVDSEQIPGSAKQAIELISKLRRAESVS